VKYTTDPLGGPPAHFKISEIALDPIKAAFKMRKVRPVSRNEIIDHAYLKPLFEECLHEV
jgi:hypothetical protein